RRLLRHVGELGHAALHPVRHLVRCDARVDFRIAGVGTVQPVQIGHEVDRFAPRLAPDTFRVRHEQYWIPFRSELDALIDCGQKSAAPARLAAVGCVLAREQDDEAGEIAAVAAEPVREPRSDAGAAKHLAARIHEDLPGRMVELRRLHRAPDRDLVGDGRKMRQQLRELGARLAVLLERERRPEQARRAFDKSKSLPFRNELGGNLFAVVLLQRGLVVEQVELCRRARHEQVNNVLRFRCEVGRSRCEGTRSLPGEQRLVEQRGQRQPADAEAGLLEEMTARHVANVRRDHCLVNASSRFKSALATSVYAACSAASTPPIAYPATVRAAASGSVRNRSSCRVYEATIRSISSCPGVRVTARRKPYVARLSFVTGAGVSRNIRAASALAASKNASSFSVVSAWSGVLVRTRRTVQCSRLVASNAIKLGYVADRRTNT